MHINPQRVKIIRQDSALPGPVVYWMSRDQRIYDNWSLIHAAHLAQKKNAELRIVFCLVDSFAGAGLRQFAFMLKGLAGCCRLAHSLNIHFDLLRGDPGRILPAWLKKINASILITDFDPLTIKKNWQAEVRKNTSMGFHLVDAHNIVPCWVASDKQEYAARTFRPKIHRLLDEFLEPFPEILPLNQRAVLLELNVPQLLKELKLDHNIPETNWIVPGWEQALTRMSEFISHGLNDYASSRNDPNAGALSNLSPYLHFGHICSQTIALAIKKNVSASIEGRDSFLEELIVRKELSDNYCYYNPDYHRFDGLPEWSRKTLNKHREAPRKYTYSLEQFEQAETHDSLWNAAQREMVASGKMHGYMRMYWAKKILEWTESPEQAIEWCIHLNDKYELDGRDPNGYTGIMWAIGGLHDRPWKERDIFGTVRYMNYNGCKRKFNVDAYIEKWLQPGRKT